MASFGNQSRKHKPKKSRNTFGLKSSLSLVPAVIQFLSGETRSMLTLKVSHTVRLDFSVRVESASVHTDPWLVPTWKIIYRDTHGAFNTSECPSLNPVWGNSQSGTNCCPYRTAVMCSVAMQWKRTPPPGQSDPARSWWGLWSLLWSQRHASRHLQSQSKDSAQDCTTGVHPERNKVGDLVRGFIPGAI